MGRSIRLVGVTLVAALAAPAITELLARTVGDGGFYLPASVEPARSLSG